MTRAILVLLTFLITTESALANISHASAWVLFGLLWVIFGIIIIVSWIIHWLWVLILQRKIKIGYLSNKTPFQKVISSLKTSILGAFLWFIWTYFLFYLSALILRAMDDTSFGILTSILLLILLNIFHWWWISRALKK